MNFDIEINEPDQPSFKNTPQKLYSYIKSKKNENTGIAPLRSEGFPDIVFYTWDFVFSFYITCFSC
jgi:hypothetical protein